MDNKTLIEQIGKLKQEKDALIIAHNYQLPEVQDIADFSGDSLELSRKAAAAASPVIVFAGVRFMAETAKILAPDRTVLLPERNAGCPLADMITPEELTELKEKHPGAAVVSYINSNIDIKAESDICCTSSNALKVVESLEEDEIIFIPDMNLGRYIQQFTEKKLHFHKGYCIVHDDLRPGDVEAMRKKYPRAKVIAHPECLPEVLKLADAVESTSGMFRYVEGSGAGEFIIATEIGMVHRLEMSFPNRRFHVMEPEMVCANMKKTTLRSVRDALEKDRHRIEIEPGLISKAERPLRRMIELK